MPANKLDEAWQRIDALGGPLPDGDGYVLSYWRGFYNGIAEALSIIEDLGGVDPYIRQMEAELLEGKENPNA